jgi:peptidoglycan/xylan/chitin deacetylase (PgdA/CDA1 family)
LKSVVRPNSRRGLILLYHRVDETRPDPLLLRVSPRRFADHVSLICSKFEVQPLTALVSDPRGIAITFDDGYVDNLTCAAPILDRTGAPATLFVTTGFRGREPWWDALSRLVLTAELPTKVDVLDETYSPGPPSDAGDWNILEPHDPDARTRMYRALFEQLRRATNAVRAAAVESLASVASEGQRPSARIATTEELESVNGVLELGAHTVSHPSLRTLGSTEQRREIEGSKADLEGVTGARVRTFAYPYGGPEDVDRRALKAVRAAGFTLACGTAHGAVTKRSERFLLPRILVRDWAADELERTLSAALRG